MGERLGQHFLDNPLVAVKIVELLNPTEKDRILEIGAGEGFLTAHLLDTDAEVIAVEIDRNLVKTLHNKFSEEKLRVINSDILKVDISKLKLTKICGNLPYQIGGKIVEKIIYSPVSWNIAVLMLPLAVAERTAAAPAQSAYGRLSALCRSAGEVKVELEVGRENFSPPPKIDSAVIKIEKRSTPAENFSVFLRGAFSERRKKIKNSLAGYFPVSSADVEKILEKYSIDPSARAQQLSVDKLEKIKEEFVKRKIL